MFRMQQAVGQLAIGGHQEHAFGVIIEATDRPQLIRLGRDQIAHGLAPFGIVERRQHRVGFEQDDRHRGLGAADVLIVELDAIHLRIDLRADLGDHRPVHANATGEDHLFSVASRGHARLRQHHMQSY